MNAFVAVTDRQWFEYLSHAGTLDEVNFWQPSAGNAFQAVRPREVDNFIAGGCIFSHWTRLRASLAWDAFGIKNGADSFPEVRTRLSAPPPLPATGQRAVDPLSWGQRREATR